MTPTILAMSAHEGFTAHANAATIASEASGDASAAASRRPMRRASATPTTSSCSSTSSSCSRSRRSPRSSPRPHRHRRSPRACSSRWLVWWQWSQFTWAGSAIDLQAVAATRVLVLCMHPGHADHDGQHPRGLRRHRRVVRRHLPGRAAPGARHPGQRCAWATPTTRRAFVRYASFAVVAPIVVLVGAFVARRCTRRRLGGGRASSTCSVRSARRGGRVGDQPGALRRAPRAVHHHLARRGAGGRRCDCDREEPVAPSGVGGVVVVGGGGVRAVVDVLRVHPDGRRAPAARGAGAATAVGSPATCSRFGHFPLVFGLVLYAVVAKHLVQHPTGNSKRRRPLDARAVGGVVRRRPAGHPVPGGAPRWPPSASSPSWSIVPAVRSAALRPQRHRWSALVAVVLGVMQAITVRRVNGRDRRAVSHAPSGGQRAVAATAGRGGCCAARRARW